MTKAIKLSDVLEKVEEDCGDASISVGDVVQAVEVRGYGPLLLVVALLTVLPTGAIPGVPTITAILILFISVQLLMNRSHPWIPNWLARQKIKRQTFTKAKSKALGFTKKIDRLIKPRFESLFNAFSVRIIAVVCCFLALSLPPLEVVPFLAFVPACSIAVLGLALSARDGLLAIFGLTIALAGLLFGVTMIA